MGSELPRPTPSELQILEAIWEIGPATVRAVHALLGQRQTIGHTTVLKLMQIMHQKGLLERDESSRTHVYRAAQPQEQTRRRLVRDLIDRAFAGSAAELVQSVLDDRRASPEELSAIRALLEGTGDDS
jgi:predicted transcriptional regulator